MLLGAFLATFLSVIGTNDLENYDHAFFSLDRGTRTESVKLFGQPVYTLSLGLGVRLPLDSSLGGSPAAIVAQFVPEPVTFWLMFAIAIAAAAVVLRYALDSACGPRTSTVAALLTFCSLPLVNYAIIDDWPDTALTYCAFVVCTFAPHALAGIAIAPVSAVRRRVAAAAVLALTFSAVVTSHAGHWPFLAVTLVCSAGLSLLRTELAWRTKLMLVALLGVASAAAVALVAPDVLGEMQLAAASGERVVRSSQGAEGDGLLAANILALGQVTSRSPFTFLLLAMIALLLAPGPDHRGLRRVIGASALVSVMLGLGATHLAGQTADFAPSVVWLLRDPASTFALLSGALAAGVRHTSYLTRLTGVKAVSVILLGAALLGPGVALRVLLAERGIPRIGGGLAPRGATPAPTRLAERGVPTGMLPLRSRIAFWPDVGVSMRNANDSQADFPDAGYLLVTASTKQRTMATVVVPNEALFDQWTHLSAAVLCSRSAVEFLQLKYMLAPTPVTCGPWRAMPGEPIDGRLIGHILGDTEQEAWALIPQGIPDRVRGSPAFGADAEAVLAAVRPIRGTRLVVRPTAVEISVTRAAIAERVTLILPVAYDSALHATSGTVEPISGLAAVVRPEAERVVLTFVPDARAISRALAMMLSQFAVCIGLIAIVAVGSTAAPIGLDPPWKRYLVPRLKWMIRGRRWKLRRAGQYWPQAVFAAAVAVTMDWQRREPNDLTAGAALLVPFVAMLIILARSRSLKAAIAGLLLVGTIVRGFAGGSRSPEAIHDPLFWSLVAAIATAGMIATRRRAGVSRVFAVAIGASAAMAALLPALPDFWTSLSAPPVQLAGQSFDALSSQLGSIGAVMLLVLCVHGIVAGAWPATRLCLGAVMARTGLVVALLFAYAGAASMPLDTTSFIVLGMLVGAADRATEGSTICART